MFHDMHNIFKVVMIKIAIEWFGWWGDICFLKNTVILILMKLYFTAPDSGVLSFGTDCIGANFLSSSAR